METLNVDRTEGVLKRGLIIGMICVICQCFVIMTDLAYLLHQVIPPNVILVRPSLAVIIGYVSKYHVESIIYNNWKKRFPEVSMRRINVVVIHNNNNNKILASCSHLHVVPFCHLVMKLACALHTVHARAVSRNVTNNKQFFFQYKNHSC